MESVQGWVLARESVQGWVLAALRAVRASPHWMLVAPTIKKLPTPSDPLSSNPIPAHNEVTR